MIKVKCSNCFEKSEFSERWLKKNDPELYICRKCKIKQTTQSDKFRQTASERSKKALADPNIKSRMSQKAQINNVLNADKISKSLKEHYSDPNAKRKLSERSSSNWQDQEYRNKVKIGLENKWEDPEYRGKVLGSRMKIKKKTASSLDSIGLEYEANFPLGAYVFDAFISGVYLYDEQPSQEKRLFVEHYFKQFKYINDLAEVETPEN